MPVNSLIYRTEAYAEKVRKMFAETVNEILALNKAIPELEEGKMYSFAGDKKQVQNKVEALLRRLHSAATLAIKNGIKVEWGEANKECDKLVSSVFGMQALNNPSFGAYTKRNTTAMNAFINRSSGGLGLSERIWNSCRQLKDEMEVALTVAMGEGASAQEISRGVRKYLNDPDLMFRRFRYKAGEKEIKDPETGKVTGKEIIWGKKWKKRIFDEATGKYKWIDYDKESYIPKGAGGSSRGVYKSSAKNAMRVARTETNMAYRNADCERWSKMDFILGIHIEPSTHTKKKRKKDICDKLAGDYPKDFVFEGWHPQCFCIATPIMPSDEEMIAEAEARRRGEKYVYKRKPVTDYPSNFKRWVGENAGKIMQSRVSGTEPYFLAHNKAAVDNIIDPKPKRLTTLEKAEIRHKNRTPEQTAAIQKRAAERAKAHQLIKANADNFLKVAKDYGEVDYSTLQKYIKENNLTAMEAETKRVGQTILNTKKQEQALSDLIPDVHNWHKQFTMEKLQGTYKSVEDKLKIWEGLSLEEQAKNLDFEMSWVAEKKKYSTWPVAHAAYSKKLGAVQEAVEWKNIKKELAIAKDFKTTSKPYHNLLNKLEEAISLQDKMGAQSAITSIMEKRNSLGTKSQTLRVLTDKEIKVLLDNFKISTVSEIDDVLRTITEEAWKKFTHEEKLIVTKYTSTYSYLNEPLRGIPYTGERSTEEYLHDLPVLTNALKKCRMPKDMVVRRGTNDFAIKSLGYNLSNLKAGDVFIDKGFLSTGAQRKQGFFKTYDLVIVVPKGAQGIFAEPFSHYTDNYKFDYSTGVLWDGKSKETINGEFEWIGQRGSEFKVLKKDGNRIFLQLLGQLK